MNENMFVRCDRESYTKELLLLQKLIRFRRHELYSEDEALILSSLLKDIETAIDICADNEKDVIICRPTGAGDDSSCDRILHPDDKYGFC